jgi:predicted alpha-1,2-mannosidase
MYKSNNSKILFINMLIIACIITIGCKTHPSLTNYINPRNGTEHPGNTVIGPQVPWGSINPSPDVLGGTNAGYTKDGNILGFSQTHVSGTGGAGHYGNFLITPVKSFTLDKKYSGHEKSDEQVECGYYSVSFNNNIINEVTSAHNSAIYRFTFPEKDSAFIQIDLSHYIPRHILGGKSHGILDGFISVDHKTREIEGYGRYVGGWSGSTPYDIYFAAEIDKPVLETAIWQGDEIKTGNNFGKIIADYDSLGCMLRVKTDSKVFLKIAVSMKSIEQARTYLSEEIPGFDFEKVLIKNIDKWEQQLRKIRIKDPSASDEQLTIFYSNLYHTMKMPRDRSRDNLFGGNKPYWDDQYAIWDTYRTLFPLHTLINESFVSSNINFFIDRFEQDSGNESISPALASSHRPIFSGYVSDVFIAGRPGVVQGGDNVDVVIADAFVKGVKNVEWENAYQIIKYHADNARDSFYLLNDHGWLAHDLAGEAPRSGSRTLEFNYNDFCVAQVASGLDFANDAARYLSRSKGWENLWDYRTADRGAKGFIRPRMSDGTWVSEFDPYFANRQVWFGHFYEGNSWQYSYYVPHQMDKLIKACGGADAFEQRTDTFFSKEFQEELFLGSWENEPTFLVPFAYYYIGKPEKSVPILAEGRTKWTVEGPPGNDDSGALSSWYVFANIGLFPIAGQNIYLLLPPVFKNIYITRDNGTIISIEVKNKAPENKYIKEVFWNGKRIENSWIKHTELIQGGKLVFEMASEPLGWGKKGIPPSIN